MGSVGLYVHRCVLGASPPRCSRVVLASFSSRGGGGIDYIKLNQSISASTSLREVLSVVRESHSDFRPRDASLACHRLAKHVGKTGQTIESDQDVATFQLAIAAAKRTAHRTCMGRRARRALSSEQDKHLTRLRPGARGRHRGARHRGDCSTAARLSVGIRTR